MVAARVAAGRFRGFGVTRVMVILRGICRRQVFMFLTVGGIGVRTGHRRRVRGYALQGQGDHQEGNEQGAQRIHQAKSKPIRRLRKIAKMAHRGAIGSRPDAATGGADGRATFITRRWSASPILPMPCAALSNFQSKRRGIDGLQRQFMHITYCKT